MTVTFESALQPLQPLGKLTSLISSGSTPKGGSEVYLQSGPVMLIRSQNVRMNMLELEDIAYVTDEIDAGMVRSRVMYGDVLLNITGASIGRASAFEVKDVRANVNQHVCIIRPKSNLLYHRYLTHLLCSPEFQADIMRIQHGGTRQALTFSQISDFKIPLPKLPEQRRIADILDRADDLSAKRCTALARLDELTQAIFIEMFGDPIHGPKKCHQTQMGELLSAPPIFGSMIPPEIDGGPWLSLRVGNIQDWQLDLSDKKFIDLPANMQQRHSVRDGDVLLARAIASQEHLGKAVVVYPGQQKWAFDSHLMRLRFNQERAEPRFIQTLLKNPSGRALFLKASRRSAVQYNINTGELSGLVVPIPAIEAQRDFICIMDQIGKLHSHEVGALASLDDLFASLQDRAFRGAL